MADSNEEVGRAYEDSDLETEIVERFKRADDATGDWRTEVIELYDLYSGRHWSDVDRIRMEEQERPMVTMNLAGKFLDAVQGLQINNRQEIQYLPRSQGDAQVNELLTGAVDWARDGCDALTEESEAFLDCIIGGVGATETLMDFDEDPEGIMMIERRDPLELWWDERSRKRNMLDARWVQRVVYMDDDQIEDRWGAAALDKIGTGAMNLIDPVESLGDEYIHHATEAWKYEHDAFPSLGAKMRPVVEYQRWKRRKMYQVTMQGPSGIMTRNFTPEQWERLKPVLSQAQIPYKDRNLNARHYLRAFMAGNITLEDKDSHYQDGFTYGFITGKRDRNKNGWHALGRSIKDPSKWVNKFFSEILYIISVNSKGGLIAEEDAFVDPAKAEKDWARPDSITMVEDGAIDKVREKAAHRYPEGLDRLMQFSMNALPETSGLNLEIMGMAGRQQAGVLESQRKQSAMTIIAWAFDSMRRYYKVHGKTAAHFVKEYMADGRLIRIVGDEGRQYIPLLRDELTFDYDIIVDDAPSSTNMRERTWAILMEMLPLLREAGLSMPAEVLEHSPLPSGIIEAYKQQLNNPEQEQAEQQAQQLEFADADAEIKNTQADTAKKESEAEKNRAQITEIGQKAKKTAAETGSVIAGA